jgi:autotransporter-associated beta strand protein
MVFNNRRRLDISANLTGENASLSQTGSGTTILSGNNTYTGGTTISAGAITVGNNSALGSGNVLLAVGSTLNAGASVTITNAVSLSGAATINAPNSHSLTISGVLNDGEHGLVVAGSGSLTFSNGLNSISALASSGTIGTISISNNQSLTIGGVLLNSTTYTGLTSTGSITLINTGATTINSGVAISTTGGDINIVTSRFTNNAGSSALSATGTDKYWRVWSTNEDPFGVIGVGDTKGDLASDFIEYAATYGATTVSGTGNGFLYTLAPTITVSLNGSVSKVYDATRVATLAPENYSYSGKVNGDEVIFSIAATYDTKDVGTAKLVSATVSDLQATNSSIPVYGYALSANPISDNIGVTSAKAITVTGTTATGKTYDAGLGASIVTTSSALTNGAASASDNKFYSGDDITLVKTGATGSYATKDVDTNKAVSVTGFTLTGADAGNYTVSDASGATATISARPINVIADLNQSKVYGDVNPVYTYTAEAQGAGRGLVVGDSLIGNLARVPGENVGRYAITQGTLANTNYAIAFVEADFVINKAVLTLTPSIGQSKNYGRSDPIYAYSLSGYINNDVVQDTSVNTSITGLLARAPGESIGSYAYNATGLSASNYRILVTESPSVFTILPAPIGVVISGTYSGTNIIAPNSFTVTGLAFGETIASISSAVVNSVNVADNGSNYVSSVIGVSGSA